MEKDRFTKCGCLTGDDLEKLLLGLGDRAVRYRNDISNAEELKQMFQDRDNRRMVRIQQERIDRWNKLIDEYRLLSDEISTMPICDMDND